MRTTVTITCPHRRYRRARRDDLAAAFDDRPDRDFIDAPRVDSQVEGQGHVEGVVSVELRRAHLLERANQPGAGGRSVSFHGGQDYPCEARGKRGGGPHYGD